MAIGSTLSILCSEDVARLDDDVAANMGQDSFHKNFFYRFWHTACKPWPIRDVLHRYSEAVVSNIPTLMLSGALDPITPPATARLSESTLSNVLYLIAANAGHNVSSFGCAPKIMAEFIELDSWQEIDGSCLNDPVRPHFIIASSGPRP